MDFNAFDEGAVPNSAAFRTTPRRRVRRTGGRSLRQATAASLTIALVTTVLVAMSAGPVQALPADLDPTFGTGGTSIVEKPGSGLETVAVQPDGRIVAAGGGWSGNAFDLHLARYLTNGALDPTFGDGGHVVTDLGGQYESFDGVVIQADGKILTIGHTFLPSDINIFPVQAVVTRYESNGALDVMYGTDGHTVLDRGANFWPKAAALQVDGKLVVGGDGADGLPLPGLIRLNTDGSADRTFPLTPPEFAPAVDLQPSGYVFGVAIQASGDVVVALSTSSTNGASEAGVVATRVLTDGTLDPTFGSSGTVRLSDLGVGEDLALQSDEKLLFAHSSTYGSVPRFNVTRLTAEGALDSSFGRGGTFTAGVGDAPTTAASAVAVNPNGTVTVAGWASVASQPYAPHSVFVAQLTAGGVLDPGFGAQGIATYLIGGRPGSAPSDVAIQADGKPVIVGRSPGFVLRLQGSCAAGPAPRCPEPRAAVVSMSGGKVMSVPGGRPISGAGIIQWGWNGGGNQQWRLEPIAPGVYKVVSVATGMVLDVAGGSRAPGARVVQWPWNGRLNQQWAVVPFPANQNLMVLVSMNSGLVLNVAGGLAADGTHVVQEQWRGGWNQIWYRSAF